MYAFGCKADLISVAAHVRYWRIADIKCVRYSSLSILGVGQGNPDAVLV